jgi:DNA-binding CsgD family transcriptional regulator/tetratricopeptide (TPR) repeat protein
MPRGPRDNPDQSGGTAWESAGISPENVATALAGEPMEVRAVADALAVLGRADPDLLGALVGLPAGALADGLRTLRRHRLLDAYGTAYADEPTRAAVLAMMAGDDVQHLRIFAATALSDAGWPVEEAADQLVLAPDWQQPWMAGLLRDAAARARLRGESAAEVAYLTRALAAEPGNLRLRRDRAEALVRVDPGAAVAALADVLASSADPRERATIAVRLAQATMITSSGSHAVDVLMEALSGLTAASGPEPVPEDRQLRALLEVTLLAAGLSGPVTAAWTRKWARTLPAPPGEGAAERQLLAVTALHQALDGGSALAVARRARQAVSIPELNLVGWSELSAAFALHLADDSHAALAELGRVVAAGRRAGNEPILLLASAILAYVRCDVGDLAGSVALAQSTLARVGPSAVPLGTLLLQTALIMALVARGELERAEELSDGLPQARSADCVFGRPAHLMARAAILGRREPEAALAALAACGESLADAGIDNPVFAPWWLETALLLGRLGRPAQAAAAVEHGTRVARRWGTPRARGLALLARGATTYGDAGVLLLTEAASVLARTPARLDYARAERLLGHALLHQGDARRARRHLRRALDQATRCDCPPLIAETQALLALAGMTPGDPAGTVPTRPSGPLTDSEAKVAALAASGLTNRAVAASLFVSVRTVELHLTSVYRKFGITSRAGLAAALSTVDAAPAEGRTASQR